MILNRIILTLVEKALDSERAVLFDALRQCRCFIPREWTKTQRVILLGCRRPRMRQIGKWLGVPLLRRRVLGVPGSLIADRAAIQDIYGYRFEEVSENPFLVTTFVDKNRDATFKLMLSHFFEGGARAAPQDTWIETRDKSGNTFIEKWRCTYDGKWFSVLSELRFVMCKYQRSCRHKKQPAPPWIKNGAYCVDGWPLPPLQKRGIGSWP